MTPLSKSFAELQLRDQVAVVTGGSRGIGRATAYLLADLGAHVVVNYVHNAKAADEVVNDIRSKGVESFAFKADVANLAESRRLIQATTERFHRIDILVCAAGIWEGAPVDKMTEEQWDRTLNINLKGTWAVCSAAVAVMKEQRSGPDSNRKFNGGPERGSRILQLCRVQGRPNFVCEIAGSRIGRMEDSGKRGRAGLGGYGDD